MSQPGSGAASNGAKLVEMMPVARLPELVQPGVALCER